MEWGICGLVRKMKTKQFIKENYYINFLGIGIFISCIYLTIIRIQTSKIVQVYPNLHDVVKSINIISLCFIGLLIAIMLLFMYIIRSNLVKFSDSIILWIDSYISGDKDVNLELNKDNLICKIQNKLKQMVDIIDSKNDRYLEEKDSIKSLISDISHQIKTPIANIAMFNETLISRDLDREKELYFLKNMKYQVDKLEWLVKSLIKMSRLETGIIELNIKKSRISDTIANALSGIYLKAEEKNIALEIDIDDKLELYHDKKWTTEAIFNIIENAVKYTPNHGNIKITLEKLEMFTKVNIIDNGIGIDEYEINQIFKRFYRSENVSDTEGVGIGLYLAREIINKQSGYIKVVSEKDIGTIFSIYFKSE